MRLNAGLSGIALTLGVRLPALASTHGNPINPNTTAPANIINAADTEGQATELMTWISIDKKGKVTLLNHRAEMGQGSFQSVPQMIAEELEVDLDQVNIIFAPGNQKKYGSQITGGSSTIRGSYRHLLRIGASAREMLIETAAKKWGVPKEECYAEKGQVIHRPTGKHLTYGELVEDAAKLQPPPNPPLKQRKDYKLIGQPMPRQDTPLKTNGAAIFGIDKRLPDMKYAVVERSPRILGKVKSFDATAAKAIPGVTHVFIVKRTVFDHLQEGVAVVADNLWSAMQGRKQLKIEWDDTSFEHLDTDQLFARMREDLNKPGLSIRTAGNFNAAFEKADKKVEAVYEAPYEAHACMEPLNCTANVKVGRKAFLDYPHEAALISKEINAPVQVVWTREDDMTQGPFRPGAVYGCKASLNKEGYITAFQTKSATQDMNHENPGVDKNSYNADTLDGLPKPWFDAIPNYSFSDIPTESPIPVMWWRSVYASTNSFAYESFIDELAHAADKDPLEFRKQHLGDDRYQALIDQLIDLSGWKTRGKNEGWGVASSWPWASANRASHPWLPPSATRSSISQASEYEDYLSTSTKFELSPHLKHG